MKCLICFLFFVLATNSVLAQTYQYLLKGSYKLDSLRQDPVDYTIRWSEENGRIDGVYADDYFAKSATVTGESNDMGRTFIVKFPEEKKGIKSLTMLVSLAQSGSSAVSLPVGVVTRDKVGNPLTTVKSSSQFLTTSLRPVAQLQEENGCTEGFGVLGGYCGDYAGLIAEEQDRRNRCNLLFAEAIRLELSTDTTVNLHLGEEHNFISTPGHSIGRIPYNPQKKSVDILGRVCGPLSGVNSSSSSCKILHLRGDFSVIRDRKHFTGTYTISEEGTNNSCRYSLSMDRAE